MEGINTIAAHHTMVPLTEMLRPTIAAGSKVALPVANFTPWASFQYVEGVPAGADGGYSISKLQILDTIIGNLVGFKKYQDLSSLKDSAHDFSETQLDTMIRDLAGKLQTMATTTPGGLPSSIGDSFGVATSQTGIALNILV